MTIECAPTTGKKAPGVYAIADADGNFKEVEPFSTGNGLSFTTTGAEKCSSIVEVTQAFENDEINVFSMACASGYNHNIPGKGRRNEAWIRCLGADETFEATWNGNSNKLDSVFLFAGVTTANGVEVRANASSVFVLPYS